MPGKRTGHPKTPRRKGICLSCGEERFFKARRLCETCWVYAKAKGTLTQFPSHRDITSRLIPGHTVCRCFSPVVDPLPLWGPGTAQCLKCGKPIIR